MTHRINGSLGAYLWYPKLCSMRQKSVVISQPHVQSNKGELVLLTLSMKVCHFWRIVGAIFICWTTRYLQQRIRRRQPHLVHEGSISTLNSSTRIRLLGSELWLGTRNAFTILCRMPQSWSEAVRRKTSAVTEVILHIPKLKIYSQEFLQTSDIKWPKVDSAHEVGVSPNDLSLNRVTVIPLPFFIIGWSTGRPTRWLI